MNANVPWFKVLVRKEYLYNREAHQGEFQKATIFGVTSLHGSALLFHAFLDNGAIYYRLPLSAFVSDEAAPDLPLDWLQVWDSFSYDLAVTQYHFLAGLRCKVMLKDKSVVDGEYLFTIDWCSPSTEYPSCDLSEHSDEHKCAHIIALDNGCFTAQPNNRVLWAEASFVSAPFASVPDYKVNTHEYSVEKSSRHATEDSDRFFYDFKEEGGKE